MRRAWQLLIGKILFTSFFGYTSSSFIASWERSLVGGQRLLASDFADYKINAIMTNFLSALWVFSMLFWAYLIVVHIKDFLKTKKHIDKK